MPRIVHTPGHTSAFSFYSREVLRYRLGPDTPLSPEPPHARVETLCARIRKAMARQEKSAVLLFGLASGALARALAASLPSSVRLVVSEPDPGTARAGLASGRLEWWRGDPSRDLLADSSPWAHKLLWLSEGLTPETTFDLVNPELSPEQRGAATRLRDVFHLGRTVEFDGPPTIALPALTLAAILHPDEPSLADFFACAPKYVRRFVAVWDGHIPDDLPLDARRTDIVRPLDGDFAAQRNVMFDACDDGWVLVLDADERLPEALWQALPDLAAQADERGVSAFHLPRLTLYPDAAHAKCGHGLWPDLQLRFFRKRPRLAYARPVHERLEGITGQTCILLNASILHEQTLTKSSERIRQKLDGFNAAARGGVRHVLSDDYPRLPLALLPGAGHFTLPARGLVLPENQV